MGVTTTGVGYSWGYNNSGQLGTGASGSFQSRSSPVTIAGGLTWSRIECGGYNNTLGITTSGIAYAWGNNGFGQLGDGTTSNRSSPVTVVGGITNWSQVSISSYHSLGVTTSGIAYSWGYANRGQLGSNGTTSRRSPVTVVGGITNWTDISSAGNAGFAIQTTA
jgi:alpha-tubulin suppressor-like RCC1 family protein